MVACSVWNEMELSGQVQRQVAVRQMPDVPVTENITQRGRSGGSIVIHEWTISYSYYVDID